MASAYTKLHRRIIHKTFPFLFRKCPGHNYHWIWDRLCFCRSGEYSSPDWHGGIYDLKTGKEYQVCQWCKYPAGQWHDLTKKEAP